MRLPPGLCLGPHLGAASSPSWQTLGLTIAEGPTEVRAPGARNPTIRHWCHLNIVRYGMILNELSWTRGSVQTIIASDRREEQCRK